jgi:adenosine deaminase
VSTHTAAPEDEVSPRDAATLEPSRGRGRAPVRRLVDLPKAHLHLHFEGAMRPDTLEEWCRRDGRQMPALGGRFGTFAAFQEVYVAARSALRTPDDLTRLTGEVVEDAAVDGARWVEIGVSLLDYRDMDEPAAMLELLTAAGAAAGRDCGVGVGWLVTADRTRPPAEAVVQAGAAATFAGRGVTSFGLANDEAAAPPEPFAAAFAIAREAGLLSAPHAGEHAGPESVRGALEALGADRIQHGVRAASDPTLVARLADAGVCLDVCPTSNLLLSVVPALCQHPLPALLAAGVRCSINADDPVLFGAGLLDEYEVCRTALGLDDASLAACARASFAHSAAPEHLRRRAQDDIDAWLEMADGPAGAA